METFKYSCQVYKKDRGVNKDEMKDKIRYWIDMAEYDPEISENKVVEIYSTIDNFSEQNKTKLALVLKAYWKDHEKWKKKKGKKTKGSLKQIDRVQKIKNILCEVK